MALWRLLLTLLLIGAAAVAASSGHMLKWVDGDTNYRRGSRGTAEAPRRSERA